MRITPDVYALDSTKGSLVYLILDREIILVDTGLPGRGKAILEELKQLKIKPKEIRHILFTHHDIDHLGNAVLLQQATKAKLWASAEDIPYIYGALKRHGIKKYFQALMRVTIPKNINPFPQDGKIGSVQIIATPGHTPGHVCLLFKDVLVAGDLVNTRRGRLKPSPALMTWNQSVLKNSIQKITAIPFKWICPAHGTPIERGTSWEALKNLL